MTRASALFARICLLLMLAVPAAGATYVVNSNADTDDGVCDATNCTLREAINAANANPGSTITFNIAPGGLQTIVTGGLPLIGSPMTIDATTQPGGGTTPRIQITEGGTWEILADNVTIRGFVFNGSGVLVRVLAGSNNVIAGNYIGTNASGTAAGGGAVGVMVVSGTTTIGGEQPGDGNVISGHNFGVLCIGVSVCTLKQNIIGLDASGTNIIGNGWGLTVADDASAVVGGPSAAARNVISGCGWGVVPASEIGLGDANSLTVENNYIGTDITGTLARPNGVGLGFSGYGPIVVTNNVISGNTSKGAELIGPTVTMKGNRVGTDSTGLIAMGNGGNGAELFATSVTIGGAAAGEGNVISANGAHGLVTSGSTSVTIQGNRIGTNVTGTAAMANGGHGAVVNGGSITVGGTAAGEGNVLSANGSAGLVIASGVATVAGNFIGTNATATAAFANGTGIQITGGADHTIGGTTAGAGNVISGNNGRGVDIALNGVVVYGNAIGTNAAGTIAIPNGAEGVALAGNGNVIGGSAAGAGNTIAFNGGAGVLVTSGTGNGIEGNSIFSNGSLGIDLAPAGVTPNDPGDVDAGANNIQNFPTLTRAVRVPGGTTTVTGVLASSVSATFAIDFYASSAADPTGYGEGQRYLGSATVTTDIVGNAPFTFTTTAVAAGEFITATATSASGDTSEFSQAAVVTTPGTLQFGAAAYSVGEGGPTVTVIVIRGGGSAGTITVDYATGNGTATAGPDYTATSGTLTFADGETSKSFTVPIIDDTINEANETFTIALSNATGGATIGAPATTTVTIVDNDPLPSLSINDVSVPEGNSGTTPATFTVTLTPASGQTVTVNFSTSDQTATAASDYVAKSGTLTFNPGETNKTIAVLINGDTVAELNETFAVNLLSPTNAVIGHSPGIGTIVNDDLPQVTINDIAVVEGNSGTTNAVLTVSLSAPFTAVSTVQWTTADGAATAGSDYTASSGTVTFNPGETTKTLAVPVIGDTIVEPNETFFVNLSAPANATIADAQGSVTIADDDGSPVISINDVAMPEGNSGTTSSTFTVVLAPASATAVTVNYATADGTAAAGSDYTAVSGTITFNPGETTKTITVSVVGDTIAESNETFLVNLSGAIGAVISDSQGVGTIVNDDGPPQVSIGDVSVTEGTGTNSTATFTVTLSASSASTITVNYATADGTANAGSDYLAASGTLTFNPGETVKIIAVTVIGDAIVEPNETLVVNLSGATNAVITRPQATGTILDDDTPPSLSIGDVSQNEGNSGTTNFAFTVTLTGSTSQAVTVNYATADGTANAGSDYAATSGTLTFPPGTTTRTINVAVVGDTAVEPNETFVVNLSGVVNATLSRAQGTGTIVNDDAATGVPSISIDNVTISEGNVGTTNAVFLVTLSAPAAAPVTVSYASANNTATAGRDYVAVSGTLLFNPGATLQFVSVPVIGDRVVEPNETFFVNLSAPVGATLARSQATGTILNDDFPPAPAPLPSLVISDTSTIEGNSGTHDAVVTVTLSAVAAGVTVQYATADQIATSPSDYLSVSGTLTFGAGETTRTISVPIVGDTVHEGDETFLVRLSSPSGATLARADATVTIADDDAPPATRMIFTVVGDTPGAAQSHFRTSLQLSNATAVPMSGVLLFHPMGATDNASDVSATYTLAPGELHYYADLVRNIGASGVGTVDLKTSNGPLPVGTIRVYNDGGAAGTAGFVLPTLLVSDALPSGSHGLLTAPPDAVSSRFNVGVRALDEGATLNIAVHAPTGEVLKTSSRSYGPNFFIQLPAADFAGMPLGPNDYLTIEVTAGRAIVYGSWIDNVTNDPSVQLARPY